MPIELDMIDINSFDEITKAQRASVGEIRVWSDGIARKKKADGNWVPVEKNYKNSQIILHENKFGENYSEYAGKPNGKSSVSCPLKPSDSAPLC